MSEPIIALDGLAKRYGPIHALEGLSLELPPGAIGLLGPNGAGKSTLIKLLLGLLIPTSGAARIAGCNPQRGPERLRLRRRVGYMPESECLIPRMNGIELVTALGQITGLSRRDAMMRAHEVLDYVGLEEARYRALDQYSTGMKQRLKLAQALVHDPELLLLDEPTNGLDPKGRKHMLDLIHDLGHAQRKSLLLCSHLLPDVERTCDRVIVIHKGKILSSGSIEEMTHLEGRWFEVEVQGEAERFRSALREEGFELTETSPQRLRVRLPDEDGDRLFELALRSQVVLSGLLAERSTLEDVFVETLARAEQN